MVHHLTYFSYFLSQYYNFLNLSPNPYVPRGVYSYCTCFTALELSSCFVPPLLDVPNFYNHVMFSDWLLVHSWLIVLFSCALTRKVTLLLGTRKVTLLLVDGVFVQRKTNMTETEDHYCKFPQHMLLLLSFLTMTKFWTSSSIFLSHTKINQTIGIN